MLPHVLLILFAASAHAACPYEIHNLKVEPCDGQANKHWTLSGVTAEFTDDCNVRFKGCGKMTTNIKELNLNYKAYKDGNEVARGDVKVCGLNKWGHTFNCPLTKDSSICATEKWVEKVPKALFAFAVGKVSGESKFKTDTGEECYKISAEIKKK